MIRVVTNGQRRPLVSFFDLPVGARADFDYLDEDEHFNERFVLYRGSWFDTRDVQIINGRGMGDFPVMPDSPLFTWHAVQTDSMWTGTVFRFPDDETVVVGSFTSVESEVS